MSGHVHPPKREKFDLAARTNTDNKGFVRQVDEFIVRPWGLYMARPTPGRAQFHYLESWLLPSLGLRANVFHFNPGHELDQDYYLDVATVTRGKTVWRAEDHYLDLVVRTGADTDLIDVEELLRAHRDRLVSTAVAASAMSCATAAIAGLAHFGHDLDAWTSAQGIQLSWRDTRRFGPPVADE